ncbi:MAG: cytochrome c maturation protein CcmE [Bacteroidia bacterium]
MKKIHILGIIIIAVAIGAIFTTLNNTSTYASFAEAAKEPDSEFHVVGKLIKNDSLRPQSYDPKSDANIFSFYMADNKGTECKVILHKTKPQDFDRSEQIVLIGKMQGQQFDASDILMKCPSKYNGSSPQPVTAENN